MLFSLCACNSASTPTPSTPSEYPKNGEKKIVFDYYIESIGLKDEFLKPDATYSYNALGTLTFGYIADMHSSIASASSYVGAPAPAEGSDIKVNSSVINAIAENATYTAARAEQLGEEVTFYQKVGNTAFVTFDSFTFDRSGNYEADLEQPIATPSTLL